MFENILGNKQMDREVQSENKQLNVAREGQSLQLAANEQAYIEEANAKSDLIRWQQDLGDSLEILKHRLRNEYWNGEQWLPKTKTIRNADGKKETVYLAPLLTEEGIMMVEGQVSPFLGSEAKNLINSNYTEARILMMLEDTSNTIADNLVDYYDAYVIDATPSNLDNITRLIKNTITSTPFRALNGWTKIQDNTMARRVETFNNNPFPEQKKFMGIF